MHRALLELSLALLTAAPVAGAAPRAPEARATTVAVDPPAPPGALAPNLSSAKGGALATWLEPVGTGHRLRFSRFAASGWTAPVTVAEGRGLVANWADVPAVVRGGDGALVASWAEARGPAAHAYDAAVARSTDGGATWSRLGLLHDDGTPTEHGFVSLLGEPGGVRAFWLDGRTTGGPGGAMTLRTATVGATVGPGAVVDARVCDCCGTAAAWTGGGALVVYRDRGGEELRDVSASRGGPGGFSAPAPVYADGWKIGGCPVNGPAVAALGRRVAVAWYTYAGGSPRVRLAFSGDAGATFGVPIEVDGPRGGRAPLGRVSVVLDEGGGAIVGWLASEREEAAVLARRVGGDGRLGAELRLGGSVAGRDAGFPHLARSGDGLLAIWTEPGQPSRLRAVLVGPGALPPAGTAVTTPGAPVPRPVTIGAPAPPVEALTLDGKPASLAGLHGKVVLLNLWATWCEPCRQELPELVALHESLGGRGLLVVGLNVDRQRPAAEIAAYVASRKLPFAVWVDPADRASAALGASTYPVNVLIGRDGIVRWRRDGALRADDPELLRALDSALAGTGVR